MAAFKPAEVGTAGGSRNVQRQSKVWSVLHTVGSFLSTFVVALVALVAVVFVVIQLLGWHLFTIDSPSMAPAYPVDALVVVKNAAADSIIPGDVITYVLNDEGVLVTHRVVSVNPAGNPIISKGDANTVNDSQPVAYDNVVGKVLLGVPGVGKPMRFITSKENRPYVIGFIAALLLLSFVWDVIERKRTRRLQEAADAGEQEESAAACTEEVAETEMREQASAVKQLSRRHRRGKH